MAGTAACELAGSGVLVTRPAHQAMGLCRLIAEHGGRPLLFPALEIQPPENPEAARRLLAQDWDLVVYISVNAVEFAARLHPRGRLPRAGRVAAVGRATARALIALGTPPDLLPERADSEGLLALQPLQRLDGQRALIVRGQGGRPLLGETLARRGAEIRYAEVYRRSLPRADAAPLLQRWERDVQWVTATSNDVLEGLQTLLGPNARSMLHRTPLVVISERMAKTAAAMGFSRVRLAAGADDEALLQALCAGGDET
jgi:uroporphyrinogen-III synthase